MFIIIKKTLEDINYSEISDDPLSQIGKSINYDKNRYTLFVDVKKNLETLSKKI